MTPSSIARQIESRAAALADRLDAERTADGLRLLIEHRLLSLRDELGVAEALLPDRPARPAVSLPPTARRPCRYHA